MREAPMLSKSARALLVAVLLAIAGAAGSAHQPSNPVSRVIGSPPHGAVPHLAPPVRAAGRAIRVRQSDTTAISQPIARRFALWAEKGNGGGFWHPIDNRPDDSGGPADDDEGGFVDPDQPGPGGIQSEMSVAVDSTGQHIVLGMNDFRGFSLDPVRLSSFFYSDDGGATFTDGGQLPVTVPTTPVAGQTYPQVFGDPEVKYLGGSTFVYFSIVVSTIGSNGLVQTLGMHRSTDYGHTWTGPYVISPATNPSGNLDANGDAIDAADKEFADVDPETGRVMVSWTNFTAARPQISVTYSDDVRTATPPTWQARRVIANGNTDGQGSIPRFAGNGSPNAYIAWERFTGFYTDRIAFSRSTDNGVTWSAPVEVASTFITMDYILGNDRVNNAPSMAVDTTSGPNSGNVYLVYASNNSFDGADISFRRSTNGGVSFSTAINLNSRPGSDRAQWFPWVTVDRTTGRVYVSYYDQGVASSGDLTETTFQYSDDGGLTWHKPMPATDRPFHAGYGNDDNQPNLGDYNQAVAQNGELFIAWAGNPPVVPFTDGQPSTVMTVPDVFFKRAPQVHASLRLGSTAFTDSGGNGFIDPGEDIHLTLPLVNYVTNPLFAAAISGISGTLSSTTAGVSVIQATSTYPSAAAGATSGNTTDYVLRLSSSFVPGTPIELTLNAASSEGSATILTTLSTGTPRATTLLSENFDGVAPGTLPGGWSAVHGAGSNAIPWTTSSTFNAGNNGAFHQNANDATGNPARWERLFSPSFTVPTNSDYVVVEFDTKYDTEDDPNLRVLAYDGFFLRLSDLTAGRTARGVLAEAFAQEFTTGTANHYPRHLPRNSDPFYFEDMSLWAGDSAGLKHVRLKLPGMAGSTAQLRFEFTQDEGGTCADVRPGHACGVLIDNVTVTSVVAASADLSMTKFGPSEILSGQNATYTLVARNNGTDSLRNTASQVTVSDPLPPGTTFVSSTAPSGWTCQTPAAGVNGTVSCASSTMAPGATASFSIVANVACATTDGTKLTNTATIASATTADPNPLNNSSSSTVTISNPPPVISGISTSPPLLWPVNHKMVDVSVNYTVSDNCGVVTTALSVSSSEPSDGQQPDWIVVDAHHLQLRAERLGDGPGRTYTILITATNDQGGVSTATATVLVPHDQGN
jgi:uncharacterized repeat protein (TIGR01451 family)